MTRKSRHYQSGESTTGNSVNERVARYRARSGASGSTRVEVTVAQQDASLIKAIAGVLRRGGEPADKLRSTLAPLTTRQQARTGKELLAILLNSAPVDEDFSTDRDKSSGRFAEFD